MRSLVLGATALTVLSGPALSADLAVKARPYAPVAAVYDWSGFYIGVNGGGGSSRSCWDLVNFLGPVVPAQSEGCNTATGATAGGQIGYRWQSANWVFGLEGQGNWADFKGSNFNNSPLAAPGLNDLSKVDAFGLLTGQVGYAVNSALLYLKGGAAVTRNKYNMQDPTTSALLWAASETRWGAVVGAGVEFGFAPNWSVAVEYDHLFMGRRDVTFSTLPAFAGGPLTGIHSINQDVDIGTVRLQYRFGGPVIAKY